MGVDNLTNEQKYGIIQDEKVYMVCPYCHKKMFRVDKTSEYKKIYLWCKNCKKEIEFNKESHEPM